MKKEKPLGMRIGESIFCAGYLIFVFVKGFQFLSRGTEYYRLCGIMTLLLGGGDAFHLIPRILINIKGESKDSAAWLGLGNLISSITMTLFYVLLFFVMKERDPANAAPDLFRLALIHLCAIRIALCLFPQNKWFEHNTDNPWGIYRNLPFCLMGILTVSYLLIAYHQWLMGILVTLSFLFYMAVVKFAGKNPKMGMLMIPKTICYIWLICLL